MFPPTYLAILDFEQISPTSLAFSQTLTAVRGRLPGRTGTRGMLAHITLDAAPIVKVVIIIENKFHAIVTQTCIHFRASIWPPKTRQIERGKCAAALSHSLH